MDLYYGTCGFPRSKKKLREMVNAVEVQQTFYKPPSLETLRKWREELGEEMRIHLKAWQLVTHPPTSPTYKRVGIRIPKEKVDKYGFLRLTDEVKEAWMKTVECAKALRGDFIVVQTPPSFGYSEENVRRAREFFKWARKSWERIAWEPRGTWREHLDAVKKIVEETGVIHAVDPFRLWPPRSGTEILYLRLHGRGGKEVNYRYKYTDEDLRELAEMIINVKPNEAHVMFNNVYMLQDALRFKELFDKLAREN
ncbi:hypothetical protein IPA_00730 [Ignicoccus pacificus DSM 13166]|uniref:DUF72 domain-containing protein n=1 Tax=Ignicoccus pacificus DSM 13166 TaxID=940294 RepID=A0A977KA74_9CREN|nr:hypothetical protein IPA_00730 [Ignicoccus pacificus DSM 13166]